MSRKRYTPEQIIGKLREAAVALAQCPPASVMLVVGLLNNFAPGRHSQS